MEFLSNPDNLIVLISIVAGAVSAVVLVPNLLRAIKSPAPSKGAEDETSPQAVAERARLEQFMRLIAKEIPEATPAERQLLLLSEYHSQGLTQSRVSFWFSLIFAAIGFTVIISAILTIDAGASLTSAGRAWITLISGTVVEAVSALFFVQSNRARKLMSEFFDRLRADRKLEEALDLAKTINTPVLQGRLQAILSLSLAEVSLTDSRLIALLPETQEIPLTK